MTNDIHELHLDLILPDLKVETAKQVLQKICVHTCRLTGTPEKYLMDILQKQEQEQSSGIGNGVAIMHARLPRLTRPLVIFTKLSRLVDFKAADGDPVDLACLVLSPEYEGTIHLSRLAKVTRFFSDKDFCDSLRAAEDGDEIRLVLKNMNTRKMAA